MEIIFVRHGESELNKRGVFCGWTDSPLTLKGIEQAHEVSRKLKDETIDRIISSDLDRCYKTAEIINKNHKSEIELNSELKELNFGQWEGLSYEDICNKYPKESKRWQEDHNYYKVPMGESLDEMYKRVNNAFEVIKKGQGKERILIISHAGVIRSILSKEISGGIKDYWKFKIDNCGIARLEYVDDFPVLKGINQ